MEDARAEMLCTYPQESGNADSFLNEITVAIQKDKTQYSIMRQWMNSNLTSGIVDVAVTDLVTWPDCWPRESMLTVTLQPIMELNRPTRRHLDKAY